MITPLPTPPSRQDPSNFSTRADAFLGALPAFATETNAVAVDVDATAVQSQLSADAAAQCVVDANVALSATNSAANVTKWVSGTTYTEGQVVWSPATFLSYRRKITGAGTTDPSADGTNYALIAGTGNVTLDTVQALTNKTISSVSNTITVDGTNKVGFREIPQNSQSTAYTLVLTDSGKHILHPSADTTARTFTIPANASVAFPIGTAITFVNQNAAGVLSIAITTDVMRLAKLGTTGTRTLQANGVATAIKLTSTEWIISGTGLT